MSRSIALLAWTSIQMFNDRKKAYGMSEEIVISDTVIRCSNRNRCKNIERYLRKKVTNDGVGKTDEAMP